MTDECARDHGRIYPSMPRYIAKLGDDQYVDWSEIVDAPVSRVMSREEAVTEYGEDRVARADRTGTSIIDPDSLMDGITPEEIIVGNRAGPNETELTLEKILERYSG